MHLVFNSAALTALGNLHCQQFITIVFKYVTVNLPFIILRIIIIKPGITETMYFIVCVLYGIQQLLKCEMWRTIPVPLGVRKN